MIITLHHFGYDDSTLAFGAFLEFIDVMEPNHQYPVGRVRKGRDKNKKDKDQYFVMLPLEIYPRTISTELDIKELETNIKAFLQDVLTVALTHLSNQI